MDKLGYDNLLTLYFSCMQGFKEFESTPRDYETGDMLYASEIHTLQMIAKNKECNLTQLAKRLGVSKSGISKFIGKLLKKDLIIKNKDVLGGKEVFFTLTAKGQVAFLAHEKFDQKMFSRIFQLLDSFSHEQIKWIEHFLLELSHILTELNQTDREI